MPYLFNLIYGLALILLSPWFVFRALTTNRYRRGLKEKFFGSARSIPQGSPVVWFHGVSVGEINLLATVVKSFRQRHPDWRCVISTTTETGMAEAAEALCRFERHLLSVRFLVGCEADARRR